MKKLLQTSLLFFSLLYIFSIPVLAQWSSATLFPPRGGLMATSVGDRVFLAGGFIFLGSPSNQIDIYDVAANQWTTATLSQARYLGAATSVGNLALFAGGVIANNPNTVSDQVDIYNATTNQWTTAKLSSARANLVATSLGNLAFFAGGEDADFIKTTIVDVYNSSTNEWTTIQLPQVKNPFQVTGAGNQVLFAGDGSGLVDIYNITTSQWTSTTLSSKRNFVSAASIDGKAIFAGGFINGVNSGADRVDIYDTATNQWTIATLSQPRYSMAATTIGNKAFFAGGSNSSTVDIYDAATNQWSSTNLPQLSGGNLSATGSANKAIFAGGGFLASNKIDIYTIASPMPVNLISFSGVWTEDIGAQLTWQTSLETNNDHFEIQRSGDAKSFETIGRVKGKGTIEAHTDYNFTDPDMPGQIGYYRLKQVDFDGTAHLSNIISVNRRDSKPQPGSITLGPVPTSGLLTIQLSTGKTINETSVYDLHGRRLSSQTGTQATIDVSALPVGVYLLNVLTTDGQNLHTRFVKQ